MGYELSIADLTEEQPGLVRRHIEEYKNERSLISDGEFYRLRSPFEENVCVWMLTDAERSQAMIYAFTPAYDVAQVPVHLRIPYIDRDRSYVDQESGACFTGSELAQAGRSFRFSKGDYPAQNGSRDSRTERVKREAA